MGTYNFSLNVYPNGLAIINSNQTFSYVFSATSISPKVSGTGGIYKNGSFNYK